MPQHKTPLIVLLLLAGLLCAGCGDAPYDPHAAEKADIGFQVWSLLAWFPVLAWGAATAACVGGVLTGVYWAAGRAWWDVRRAQGAAMQANLVYPNAAGEWPLPAQALQLYPALAIAASERAQTVRAIGVRVADPVPSHYHYEVNTAGAAAVAPVPLLLPAADLPGPCTLLDLMQTGWMPTRDAILLGLGPGGTRITVPADETLCHILIAGQTGKGKSVLFRLLMTQLLAVGLPVYLLDLAYADFDAARRLDRRPLAARLSGGGPRTDAASIAAMFAYLAGPELARRKAAMQATGDPGAPFFVFADEWPQLLDADRAIADPARQCLRLYRQYGGYFGLGSQDALVDTMGNSSGVLAQFPTGYYVGGDPTTRRRVTGLTGPVPEPAGKGEVYLRCAGLSPAALVRVPQVGNRDMYELLGWPATPPPWGWDTPPRQLWQGIAAPWEVDSARRVEASAVSPVGVNTGTVEASEASTRQTQARALLRQGVRPAEVVRRLWGLPTNTGRTADAAMGELTSWIAEWVRDG